MLTKKRILISLIFYLLVLIWIISLKMNMKDAVFGCMDYFKQFTLQERFKISLSTFRLSKIIFDADFLVNICFFMPLGAYCFELIKKNKFIKGLFIAILLTISFEIVQLITTIGFFTFNDLVSNTLGYILGYLIYLFLNKIFNRKIIFYIFNVFTIFFIALTMFGIINTIINIEIYSLYKKVV